MAAVCTPVAKGIPPAATDRARLGARTRSGTLEQASAIGVRAITRFTAARGIGVSYGVRVVGAPRRRGIDVREAVALQDFTTRDIVVCHFYTNEKR
jgi:hypothetical protein